MSKAVKTHDKEHTLHKSQIAGYTRYTSTGACPGFLKGGSNISGFLKGGGSNISWFSKKRSSDFKRD